MFLFKNNLKEHLDIFVNSKHLVVASFFLVLNFISSLLHKRNVFDLNHVIHWHFPTAFFTIPTSFYCEETCFDFITKLCMWHRAQKAEFGGHGSRLCAPMSPDSLPQKPSLPCALHRLLPEVLLLHGEFSCKVVSVIRRFAERGTTQGCSQENLPIISQRRPHDYISPIY